MTLGTSLCRLVQRWCRPYAASYNENPLFCCGLWPLVHEFIFRHYSLVGENCSSSLGSLTGWFWSSFFSTGDCSLGNGLLTYLLTPWCRALLERLTGLQLVKKFPAFHGTRRFITALTNVRHLSLSWASPIQSIYPHPTSWRSVLILSTHLRLGLASGLFLQYV